MPAGRGCSRSRPGASPRPPRPAAVSPRPAGRPGVPGGALARLPAPFSSLVIFLGAVATAAFGWIILGERVTLTQGLGGALILGGLYLRPPRHRPPPR